MQRARQDACVDEPIEIGTVKFGGAMVVRLGSGTMKPGVPTWRQYSNAEIWDRRLVMRPPFRKKVSAL